MQEANDEMKKIPMFMKNGTPVSGNLIPWRQTQAGLLSPPRPRPLGCSRVGTLEADTS